MDKDKYLSTGTTTVGLLYKEGVVLASDKRATAGNLIASKDMEKAIIIFDNMALTVSGMVSDIQLMTKYLKAEISLKDVKTGRRTTVKEAANLLTNLNYNNVRRTGGICHFLFAGYDSKPSLYDIYPDGALTEITPKTGFVASGSGSVFAFGLLEDAWKPDLTKEQAVELSVRAVNVALQRDSASGEGVDVIVIDSKGARKETQRLLNTRLTK